MLTTLKWIRAIKAAIEWKLKEFWINRKRKNSFGRTQWLRKNDCLNITTAIVLGTWRW